MESRDENMFLVPVRKLQSLRSRIMVHTSTRHATASLAHFAAPVPQIPAGHKTGNRPEPNGPGNSDAHLDDHLADRPLAHHRGVRIFGKSSVNWPDVTS